MTLDEIIRYYKELISSLTIKNTTTGIFPHRGILFTDKGNKELSIVENPFGAIDYEIKNAKGFRAAIIGIDSVTGDSEIIKTPNYLQVVVAQRNQPAIYGALEYSASYSTVSHVGDFRQNVPEVFINTGTYKYWLKRLGESATKPKP